MISTLPTNFLPIELVFHAHWWYQNYGLTFGRDFFFKPKQRVESEKRMRQILYERFGDLGLGEKAGGGLRPVIGPVHLACDYIIPELFGCKVDYSNDATPEVQTLNLSDQEVMSLEPPELGNTRVGKELMTLMEQLEMEYGYLEGDVGWDGLQNTALYLRGYQLFIDYYENPALVRRIFDVILQTQIELVKYIKKRTGTSSLSVNRVILGVDPKINLHSNCTVQMISNETYEEYLLPYEKILAQELSPYGIHHCGNNLQVVAPGYAKVENLCFLDVGWGSDVEECRRIFPTQVLSLRLSPVRMLTAHPDEIEADLVSLLAKGKPLDKIAICCINMDHGTPDDNIYRLFEVVERYRRFGG